VLHRAAAGAGCRLGEAPTSPTCGHDAPNASSTPPIAYCGGSAYPPRAEVADLGAKGSPPRGGISATEEHGRGVWRWLGPAHLCISATHTTRPHRWSSAWLHAATLPASLDLCWTAVRQKRRAAAGEDQITQHLIKRLARRQVPATPHQWTAGAVGRHAHGHDSWHASTTGCRIRCQTDIPRSGKDQHGQVGPGSRDLANAADVLKRFAR
jgi:hypothetical protein